MPTPTGKLYLGPFTFDFSHLKDKLYDLAPGAMSRLRQVKAGFAEVVLELANAFPQHAKDAGVSEDLYQSFKDHTDNITAMELELGKLQKAAEVMEESIAKEMHDRENDLSLMVQAARMTADAKSMPELLAPFELTIKYIAQSAEKALQTRRKNEEAKKAEEEAAAKAAEEAAKKTTTP